MQQVQLLKAVVGLNLFEKKSSASL